MILLDISAYLFFVMMLGYYFITNLQWYSYKLERVIFHHTKTWWHFAYFVFPYVFYVWAEKSGGYGFVIVPVYALFLYRWYGTLDKPLVFTGRIKRFFAALSLFGVMFAFAFLQSAVILPIFFAFLVSWIIEKMLFEGFKRHAQKKLESIPDLIVIGVTASYGKTSIKNFIAHLLSLKYKTYATPRSVNTLGGVMKDINDDLPQETQVYIVEMGARGEGDIEEIATFVNPHYAIVGKIGPAHIEYFKTLENIRNTKMEILQSKNLKEAWIHESVMVKPESNIHTFGTKENLNIKTPLPVPESVIENVEATLDGTTFMVDGIKYKASILGGFNAINLTAAIKIAQTLGLSTEEIQERLQTLTSVPHRLQRIDAGGKVILDDSFNGNIDGILASFELAQSYKGRKVVLTPGLVEADESLNIKVAQRANEVFDKVIVTGDLNYLIFQTHVEASKLYKLENKADMQKILIEQTQAGDLILFANDAPSFV